MKQILLLPGEYRISHGPEEIETLVGSCVSVCLYNTKTGLAAMNHFLRDKPADTSASDIGQYGSTATEYILRVLLAADPIAGHYAAQIFGGAAVIKTTSKDYQIGENNIAIAHSVLAAHRIHIIRQEVGGTRGWRIRFNTSTNTVFCRFAGQVGKKYNQKEAE